MHSSVAEQWIADPRVTGSNPVVPFLFDPRRRISDQRSRPIDAMRFALICISFYCNGRSPTRRQAWDHPKAALAWHYAKTCPFREIEDRISSHLHTTLNKSRDEKLMLAPAVLVSKTANRYPMKESKRRLHLGSNQGPIG